MHFLKKAKQPNIFLYHQKFYENEVFKIPIKEASHMGVCSAGIISPPWHGGSSEGQGQGQHLRGP